MGLYIFFLDKKKTPFLCFVLQTDSRQILQSIRVCLSHEVGFKLIQCPNSAEHSYTDYCKSDQPLYYLPSSWDGGTTATYIHHLYIYSRHSTNIHVYIYMHMLAVLMNSSYYTFEASLNNIIYPFTQCTMSRWLIFIISSNNRLLILVKYTVMDTEFCEIYNIYTYLHSRIPRP